MQKVGIHYIIGAINYRYLNSSNSNRTIKEILTSAREPLCCHSVSLENPSAKKAGTQQRKASYVSLKLNLKTSGCCIREYISNKRPSSWRGGIASLAVDIASGAPGQTRNPARHGADISNPLLLTNARDLLSKGTKDQYQF